MNECLARPQHENRSAIGCQNKVGRKEGNVLFNDALNTFYFMVIWRRTYGKGPLRWGEKKPAAAT